MVFGWFLDCAIAGSGLMAALLFAFLRYWFIPLSRHVRAHQRRVHEELAAHHRRRETVRRRGLWTWRGPAKA